MKFSSTVKTGKADTMRISEAASVSGLSVDTIRFYEKSGLLPPIGRGLDGNRKFSAENVDWLVLMSSLRETGMPLEKMRHFAELYRSGNRTISERKQVLLDHAEHLETKRAALDHCASLLERKLGLYAEIEEVPA
ncbi:MerR family transcriptional regulator [Roseibium polysiphoniae]|nr:MerR family transcriptional regulator [Roseibium polysiphoniae]